MRSLLIGGLCAMAFVACDDPEPLEPPKKGPDLIVDSVDVGVATKLDDEGNYSMPLTITIRNRQMGKPAPGTPPAGPTVTTDFEVTANVGLLTPEIPPAPPLPPVPPEGSEASIGFPFAFGSATGPDRVLVTEDIKPSKTYLLEETVYWKNGLSNQTLKLYVVVDMMNVVAERAEKNNILEVDFVTPEFVGIPGGLDGPPPPK